MADSTTWTEFKNVITSRRSVRLFTDEVIPEAVVEQCLDLALLAPNSSNLQPWEFYWVRQEDTKKKLVEYCLGQNAAKTASALIVAVARTKTWREHCKMNLEYAARNGEVPEVLKTYYGKLAPLVYAQGPCGVLGLLKKIAVGAVGIFKVVPRGPFGIKELQMWAVKTTALACENLMLAFRAAGYDTCPMEGFDERRVKKLLALPCDARVVMVVGAGRRSEKGIYGPQIRFAKERFVKLV